MALSVKVDLTAKKFLHSNNLFSFFVFFLLKIILKTDGPFLYKNSTFTNLLFTELMKICSEIYNFYSICHNFRYKTIKNATVFTVPSATGNICDKYI